MRFNSLARRVYSPVHAHRPTIEALEARHLLAATPQLLADINTQQSGSPTSLIEFQGRLYFLANDDAHGREIWSSDGTALGTQLLADLTPGPNNSFIDRFVVAGDFLYFTMYSDGLGTELWRTDGTAAGTQLMRDIAPGTASGVSSTAEMVDVGGTLFFVADDGTDEGLWKSDGTAPGTTLVKVLSSSSFSISDLTAVGDTLFFVGDDDVHGEEIWKSDGTTAGTVMVKDIANGSADSWADDLIAYSGELYFEARDSAFTAYLWKSDGTAAGTQKVELPGGLSASSFANYIVSDDWLYFTSQSKVWRTDGTLAGTSLVVDLASGPSSSSLSNFYDVNGTLYFTGIVSNGLRLYKTDGTPAGTTWLTSLEQNGQYPYLGDIAAFGGNLYFTTNSSVFGTDLWRSDGTPQGTYPLQAGIAPAGWRPELAVATGQLFFTANIGGTGRELWHTDGDYASIRIVKDFTPSGNDSSAPRNFITAGNFVYFTANDGYGEQLWVTTGAAGNAVRLTHSAYGRQSSQVEQLTPAGDLLYFVARDIQGRRYLGISDGTPGGTHSLAWPAGISDPQVQGLMVFGDGVIFTVRDSVQGVVVLQASAQQIDIVQALGPSWGLPVLGAQTELNYAPVLWQGQYYFLAYGAMGTDIWRTDGTAEGTILLRSVVPDLGYYAASLTVTDSALYFLATQSTPMTQGGLWRTDGTAEGTWQVNGVAPGKLIGVGDKLFFSTPNYNWPPTYPLSLGVTDGTPAGTQILAALLEDQFGVPRPDLKAVEYNGQLYFFGTANDSPYSPYAALWKSDGTPAGTTRVTQIGSALPSGIDMAVVGGQILISTFPHLYISDGAAEGTKVLSENYYPLGSATPLKNSIAAKNGTFYFAGASSTTSSEPFFLRPPTPATVIGRRLFYNQSKFDGLSPELNASDDNAIAPDKSAYIAGSGPATFENISSYARGINGLMIDVAGLPPIANPAGLTAADFVFRVGKTNDLSTWTAAPAPAEISFRYPTTTPDVTRVSLRWANNAIQNTWLEVTMLANDRTGLAKPEVFYFGSRIGDTGSGTAAAAITNINDELLIRANPGFLIPITSPLDFDHSQTININDALIARANPGILLKINLPAPGAGNPSAAASPLVATQPTASAQATSALALVETAEDMEPGISLGEKMDHSRGELWAYALRVWTDALEADEEEFLTGLAVGRTRRKP